MMNTFLYCMFLLLIISAVKSEDPCFGSVDEGGGGPNANCIPRTECVIAAILPGACPSYPSEYVCCLSSSKFPGRESRGVWIATVTNIDWPNSAEESVVSQMSSLEHLIDTLCAAGMNTVYFQVRPAGDALYNSSIEPWSKYLTGRQGEAPFPFWDPLSHVIDYAHSRNMEVHAWVNPYRASMSLTTDGLAANHMAMLYPMYAYPYDTFLWMDPGAEVVQNRTYKVIIDLVSRYDLDGIHMDDYFYPYPVAGVEFPDNNTYNNYLDQNGNLSRDDWRRDNVNKLVERIHYGVHEIKPWVKFSISPFGIYKPCKENGMPCSISGFDQFSGLYSDPKIWLQQGWIDMLQPQLYWKIEPPAQSYPVLLNWWLEQNTKGRYIFVGNYLSRILDGWPLSEIGQQVNISRTIELRSKGSLGNVYFSAKIFRNNVQNAVAYFAENVYKYPALQPKFPWLAQNSTRPKPSSFTVSKQGLVYLNMQSRMQDGDFSNHIHKIIVYQKSSYGMWVLYKAIRLPDAPDFHLEFRAPVGLYALVAEDRFSQESDVSYFTVDS